MNLFRLALTWSSRLHEVMGAERQNGGKRIAVRSLRDRGVHYLERSELISEVGVKSGTSIVLKRTLCPAVMK